MKNIYRLLLGIPSKHNDDCYCMNCLHSPGTESKVKSNENVCKNHDYYHVKIPDAYKKILRFNQKYKSMRIPFHLLSIQIINIFLTKCLYVITIQKNRSRCAVIHYLATIHLTATKAHIIFT